MTAQDYPISFGYLAQDGKYYGENGLIGLFHKGNDRVCPVGTPVVIEGITIGETGNTGSTGGPHSHIQAWTGAYYNTQDPTPFEFRGGTVVAVSDNPNQQWGKHVTIEVDGVNVTYAHLNDIFVQVGDVIKKEEVSVDILNDSPEHIAVKRHIMARIGGWDSAPVFSGEFDQAFSAAYNGKSVFTMVLQEASNPSSVAKLAENDRKIAEYDSMSAQLKVTQESLSQSQKALSIANDEIKRLQAASGDATTAKIAWALLKQIFSPLTQLIDLLNKNK